MRQRNKDLLIERDSDEPVNYIVYGHYEFDDRELGAYLIKQKAQDGSNEDPLFIGIQSSGDFVSAADYWLQLGLVRGHHGDKAIHGWGLDVGLVYSFDAPLSPSLTLGYAYGSGDSNGHDGVLNAFRQTGLHDNEEDLGGLVGFHYLGVVLDPELSNIEVYTAGVGIHPYENFSTQLVAHYYRQVVASSDMETNLDVDPNGNNPELGYAIDWVTGINIGEAIEIEAIAGYFNPGGAFDNGSDSAYYLKTEFEYEF